MEPTIPPSPCLTLSPTLRRALAAEMQRRGKTKVQKLIVELLEEVLLRGGPTPIAAEEAVVQELRAEIERLHTTLRALGGAGAATAGAVSLPQAPRLLATIPVDHNEAELDQDEHTECNPWD